MSDYTVGERSRRLQRDMRACLIDGVFFALMVGFAEAFIAAFVLRLGLGPIAAGLVLTVPLLLGAVIQLRSPRWVRRVGSYPKFIGGCAAVQAFMYLPLAACAIAAPWVMPRLVEAGLTWVATIVVFFLATLYYTAGLACGPAWNTIAGHIIPARIRAVYFGRRTRWLQVATLLALLSHGAVFEFVSRAFAGTSGDAAGIDAATATAADFRGDMFAFAAVFLVGAALRTVSAWYLAAYSEPDHKPDADRPIPLKDFVRRLRHNTDGRFLLYVMAVGVATQISQPYFNPYMLDVLRLEQSPYAWLLAAAFLGKVLAQPTAGRLARKHTPGRVLAFASLGIIPVSLIWLVTDQLPLLIAGQILAGAMWGTWELCVFLFNYEAIKPEERTGVLTNFNFINEFSKTSGSFMGGAVLRGMGEDTGAYAAIFWISTAGRLLTLPLLAGAGLASIRPRRTQVIDTGPIAVRAGAGAVDEPLLADVPPDEPGERDDAGGDRGTPSTRSVPAPTT